MRIELPPLPFAKNALEPHLSARTVDIHYEKHHRGYLEKLNQLAEREPRARGSLEQLVREAEGEVYDLAAQAWNHNFYWKGMRAGGGGKPEGTLLACLEAAFGGFANFQRRLAEAANGHFGSGWAWLALDPRQRLRVLATHDADNPLRHGLVPLWTIDVWEHAYYLDVQADRSRYVEAVIDHLIDWDRILRHLERAIGGGSGPARAATKESADMQERKRETPSFDEVKGRAKEAAGVMTDDKDLEREGELDQVAGKVKRKASEAVDKARRVLRGKREGGRR